MHELPVVLATDVIRSAKQDDSHGGAYLVDLNSGRFKKVLDWNAGDIDFSGRGQGRGLRGIAFYNDQILIAASDELFVFDKSFQIVNSYRNQYLRHCHEIYLQGSTLYITSTLYDCVLVLDLVTGRFTQGITLRYFTKPDAPKNAPLTENDLTLSSRVFDPGSEQGPRVGDTTHINNVWRHENKTLVSGVKLRYIYEISENGFLPWAPVPFWTHNARPYKNSVLFNATENNMVCQQSFDGKAHWSGAVPSVDSEKLVNANLPKDFARPGFARGLCVGPKGHIIAGASPSTITAYDSAAGSIIRSVNLTMDVRNAIHGLEVWPWPREVPVT